MALCIGILLAALLLVLAPTPTSPVPHTFLSPIRHVSPSVSCCVFFAPQRSLGVLAELFGGGSAAPARPTGEASGASSAPTAPTLESGGAGVDNVGDGKAASASTPNAEETQERGSGGVHVELPKTEDQQQEQQATSPVEGETPLPAAGVAAGSTAEAPGQQRFVAHMPKLTDIFTVQDKVSTKKSREEKEKDKGFKVVSLFDGLAEAAGPQPVTAADQAAKAGGFSFAFGSGAAWVPAAHTDEGEGTAVTVSAAGQSEQPPSPRPSPGVHSASGPAEEHGTPPSAASALQGTETGLWRPLGDVVAIGARFVRTGKREHVEATWLGERRALTQDFKRKHKDAVKGRRGAGAGGAALKTRKRR